MKAKPVGGMARRRFLTVGALIATAVVPEYILDDLLYSGCFSYLLNSIS